MSYSAQNIRNICLLGHGGNGKTTLAESMLFLTGAVDRLGKVPDGNSTSDFDPEEIRRQISISASVIPVEYNGSKINVLDTPGSFDFAGAVVAVAGLMLAKIPTVIDADAESQRTMANLRDGWRAVSANRGLVLLIGGVMLGMVTFGPLSALCPLMVLDHFGGDGYAASLTEASFGVGMLVGSGVLMAMQKANRLAHLIALAAIVVGASTAACGLLPPTMFWAFVALVAVMAMACAWFNGPMMTLIQRHVPEEKLGRAIGLFTAVTGVAAPVGVAAGGALAEAIGVAPFFLVDGLACLALGCLVLVPRSIRALDEPSTSARAAEPVKLGEGEAPVKLDGPGAQAPAAAPIEPTAAAAGSAEPAESTVSSAEPSRPTDPTR